MTVAQIQTNPTNLDLIDKINEIIRNLLYVDDSTIKICGGGNQCCPTKWKHIRAVSRKSCPSRFIRRRVDKHQRPVCRPVLQM